MKLFFTILFIFFNFPDRWETTTEVFIDIESNLARIAINKKFILNKKNYQFLNDRFKLDTARTNKCWREVADGLKRMVFVDVKSQKLEVVDFVDTFRVVLTAKISSGRIKSSTPTGTFTILKKRISRHSRKYGGTMTFWNCLTPNEAMGIHGLKNQSYQRYLGRPVSHGCIRIGKNDEKVFYSLTPIGTKVLIE